MLTIRIDGIPIPWRGAIVTKRGAFNPRYLDMQIIKKLVRQQYGGVATPHAVRVDFEFRVPIPKSFSKKKREMALRGELYPVKRPDKTNLEKLYEDCLTSIVYVDDSQIVIGTAEKIYDENPCVLVRIHDLENSRFFMDQVSGSVGGS